MPNLDAPKRKSMFLGPEALENLRRTSSRRPTERAAMEEALALLAEEDARFDALNDWVEWAVAEFGEPDPASVRWAKSAVANR